MSHGGSARFVWVLSQHITPFKVAIMTLAAQPSFKVEGFTSAVAIVQWTAAAAIPRPFPLPPNALLPPSGSSLAAVWA